MSDQGCQDGNCILRIEPMAGQHTNAGCHCLARLPVPLRIAIERKITSQYREIQKLKAKLPRTADGEPVTPGMTLYGPGWALDGITIECVREGGQYRHLYSTREAFQRAKER